MEKFSVIISTVGQPPRTKGARLYFIGVFVARYPHKELIFVLLIYPQIPKYPPICPFLLSN